MNISEEAISRIVSEMMSSKPAAPVEAVAPPERAAVDAKTARAAVLVKPRQLEIKEFPLREIGPDEILVRVEACGVCGTDVHCYKSDPFGLTPNCALLHFRIMALEVLTLSYILSKTGYRCLTQIDKRCTCE